MQRWLDTLAELVQKLRATNSNKEKQGILKSYVGHEDEEFIKKALEYTYNPYKRYGVSEQVYERATNSNKEKQGILKSYVGHEDEEFIKKALEYTYNPYKRYGVSEQVYETTP